MKSRGVDRNPRNRFERFEFEPGDEPLDGEGSVPTEFYRDPARSIISRNDSPDVGFDASVNPYRGCEHGCVYCFARPSHEYLGFSAGLDFESRILVKEDAPRLLESELDARSWIPEAVAMSGVTDPYQPVERRLGVTRGCLEVLARRRNPVIVITKSDLVVRDIDILADMAAWNGAIVHISVTTLDIGLARRMEPRAAPPARRLEAIERLSTAGIPVGVLASPIVPGLTDWEIPRILSGAGKRGARFAGYIPLRLPYGVADLFEKWLEEHFPSSRAKVLNRIQSIRGGRLNDPRFRTRMRGRGPYADEMSQLFRIAKRNGAFEESPPRLNLSEFRPAPPRQRDLFD